MKQADNSVSNSTPPPWILNWAGGAIGLDTPRPTVQLEALTLDVLVGEKSGATPLPRASPVPVKAVLDGGHSNDTQMAGGLLRPMLEGSRSLSWSVLWVPQQPSS